MKPPQSPVMTLLELSDYLRIHQSTVYRMIKRGELPHFRIGSDFRFNREQIDAWMAARTKNSARGW
jgi:excisionase family DNA binding protein